MSQHQQRPAVAGTICCRRFCELDLAVLYAILALRVDVFVVEQNCPYPEVDGRDLEDTALHLYLPDALGLPRAYLRLLTEPAGALRIGRVVTRADSRGMRLAGTLLQHVVDTWGTGADLVMGAQAHLQEYYGGYGFSPDGPGYLEDGIPHVPMRRSRD